MEHRSFSRSDGRLEKSPAQNTEQMIFNCHELRCPAPQAYRTMVMPQNERFCNSETPNCENERRTCRTDSIDLWRRRQEEKEKLLSNSNDNDQLISNNKKCADPVLDENGQDESLSPFSSPLDLNSRFLSSRKRRFDSSSSTTFASGSFPIRPRNINVGNINAGQSERPQDAKHVDEKKNRNNIFGIMGSFRSEISENSFDSTFGKLNYFDSENRKKNFGSSDINKNSSNSPSDRNNNTGFTYFDKTRNWTENNKNIINRKNEINDLSKRLVSNSLYRDPDDEKREKSKMKIYDDKKDDQLIFESSVRESLPVFQMPPPRSENKYPNMNINSACNRMRGSKSFSDEIVTENQKNSKFFPETSPTKSVDDISRLKFDFSNCLENKNYIFDGTEKTLLLKSPLSAGCSNSTVKMDQLQKRIQKICSAIGEVQDTKMNQLIERGSFLDLKLTNLESKISENLNLFTKNLKEQFQNELASISNPQKSGDLFAEKLSQATENIKKQSKELISKLNASHRDQIDKLTRQLEAERQERQKLEHTVSKMTRTVQQLAEDIVRRENEDSRLRQSLITLAQDIDEAFSREKVELGVVFNKLTSDIQTLRNISKMKKEIIKQTAPERNNLRDHSEKEIFYNLKNNNKLSSVDKFAKNDFRLNLKQSLLSSMKLDSDL